MTGDLPVWGQTLTILATVSGTAFVAVWQGRKKKPEAPTSEGQVVMGTFIDRQAIRDLITTTANLHGTLNEMVELMKSEKHRREVEKAVRDELERRGHHE